MPVETMEQFNTLSPDLPQLEGEKVEEKARGIGRETEQLRAITEAKQSSADREVLGRLASARMVGSRLQAMLQAVASVRVRAVPISAMAYPRSCQGLVLPGPVVLYQKWDRRTTVRVLG